MDVYPLNHFLQNPFLTTENIQSHKLQQHSFNMYLFSSRSYLCSQPGKTTLDCRSPSQRVPCHTILNWFCSTVCLLCCGLSFHHGVCALVNSFYSPRVIPIMVSKRCVTKKKIWHLMIKCKFYRRKLPEHKEQRWGNPSRLVTTLVTREDIIKSGAAWMD